MVNVPLIAFLLSLIVSTAAAEDGYQQLEFASADGLTITGDLYQVSSNKSAPLIVLCHQAGWSRGEYREIAPRLNELGFNCLAIDQRSGGAVNGVNNRTAERAKKAQKPTSYVDAEQDIIAAVKFAKSNYADGKVLLWGSSYSSALVLRIAGENPDLIDGVLAFAPGEYFVRQNKPSDWIAQSAKKIDKPVFITSAKNEFKNWQAIFNAIEGKEKVKFVPATNGNHGSRALWKQFDDSQAYWTATTSFLKRFL